MYTTCPPHVLQKEELLTKIYLYRVGRESSGQYQTIGGSGDWARGSMGIKWVFLFELPPGNFPNGPASFMLPARAIKPTAKSIFQAFRKMAVEVSHRIL